MSNIFLINIICDVQSQASDFKKVIQPNTFAITVKTLIHFFHCFYVSYAHIDQRCRYDISAHMVDHEMTTNAYVSKMDQVIEFCPEAYI